MHSFFHILRGMTLLGFFFFGFLAHAEGPPWQNISELNPTGDGKVGIGITVGDASTDHQGPFFYFFDPVERSVTPVLKVDYRSLFPEPAKTPRERWGVAISEIKVSDQETLKFDYQECEQGEEGGPRCRKHYATYKGMKFSLNAAKACPEGCIVTKVEKVGDFLLFGFGQQGEYAWYGYGFQLYDIKSKALVLSSDPGTKGLLVSLIVPSGKSDEAWVASNLGLHRIKIGSKSVETFFFHEGFNSESGVAQFIATKTPERHDPFSQLARRLLVKDSKSYYAAVKALPPYSDSTFLSLEDTGRDDLLPVSFNTLVPFLLVATENKDPKIEWRVYSALCIFDDPRVVAAVVARYSQSDAGSARYVIQRCFDRYSRMKRIPVGGIASIKEGLLNQINVELKKIRELKKWTHGAPRPNQALIIQNVDSLKNFGDHSGFNALNSFFRESSFTESESYLFEELSSHYYQENALLPMNLEALSRSSSSSLSRACRYFNMRWDFMPRRFSSNCAMKIVKAVQRFREAQKRNAGAPSFPIAQEPLKSCVAAFQSQLKGEGIEAVFRDASIGLSPEEKKLIHEMRTVTLSEKDK